MTVDKDQDQVDGLILLHSWFKLRPRPTPLLPMKTSTTFRSLLLLISMLILSACASTRSLHEWRDEAYTGKLDNILVIAAIDDGARKREVEDSYVARFNSLSIAATPAYELIADSELTRETVEAALGGSDIDSVLVTRLLGVEEVEQYQPPSSYSHYRSYHRYHARALDYSSPGYYRKYKVLTLESTLYDRATQQLVWSVQSETIDSTAPQKIIDEQIDLTVERLSAHGLLGIAE